MNTPPATHPAGSQEPERDENRERDVMEEYGMEEGVPDPAILQRYIKRYPQYRQALEEFHIALTKEKYGRPIDE